MADCVFCSEPVFDGEKGPDAGLTPTIAPTSSTRNVMGGIGHLLDHAHFCGEWPCWQRVGLASACERCGLRVAPTCGSQTPTLTASARCGVDTLAATVTCTSDCFRSAHPKGRPSRCRKA